MFRFQSVVDMIGGVNRKTILLILVSSTVLLFPIVIASVNKAGGILYVFLLLISLSSITVWKDLEDWEKKILIGFIAFFLLICLSIFNSEDFSYVVKRVGRLLHFPLLIPMVLLVRKLKLELGRFILISLLVASVVMFGLACYEVFVLNNSRVAGGYQSLILGNIAMLNGILIGVALTTVVKEWWMGIVSLIAIVMALYVSVVTGARGGWLFLPIFLVWVLWLVRKIFSKKVITSFFALVVLVLIGLFNIKPIEERIFHAIKMFNIYMDNPTLVTSIGIRLNMWQDSVTIWQKHPIIGTGLGDFKGDSIRLFEQGKSLLRHDLTHAHSVYFDKLATTGTVGFLAMIVFVFWMPYRMFLKHWQDETDDYLRYYALAGMTTVLAFAVFGLTEDWLARNPFVRTYLMFILIFMTSIAVRKEKQKQVEGVSHKLEEKTKHQSVVV